MADLTQLDRVRGALLGLACGDALGAPAEFKPLSQVRRLWPNGLTEMVGGGCWAPGEWTDDTGMTLCVAEGILTHPDDPVPETGRRFLEWRRTAKDVGSTIAAALNAFAGSWPAASRGTPQARSGKAAGNGSLMRTLPVALAYSSPVELQRQSARLSAMTHWDPQAEVGCLVYCLWIRELLQGTRLDTAWRAAILEARHRVQNIEPVAETPGPQPLPPHFWPQLENVEQLEEADLQPSGYAGYVLECLVAAAWCCLKSGSLEETLVRAVNLGGEADTIAAVAGGAAGAYWGVNRIPERWLQALHQRERLERVARQLDALPDHLTLYRGHPGIPPFTFAPVTDRILAGRNPLSRLDVERLVAEGVTHILDLRERKEWDAPGRLGAEAIAAIPEPGVQYQSVPIPDTKAPDAAALDAACRFLTRALETPSARVYVHCRGGVERTGAVLTAWTARKDGVTCAQALDSLQAANSKLRPLSHQIEAVTRWLNNSG